ncbi:Na/Pi symporter [Paenibacillus sp. HB172176]|uniref:Na/Pi cotransporter family protein n=1 Tax=Paenibacillus sp. HB172176 TaxID=2493690 RepID=UPI0014397EF2|nr:Na/Pi symporter [Paenibacillus sp. HB172176]
MFQTLIMPLLFGFAVFLCGMKLMELALHRLGGPYLNKLIHSATDTPVRGMTTGAVATAFLQSSTAVTLISIGMVNAGLLTFPRTLGIILGTNIGTCLTTELIGLEIHQLALPLLVCSILMWLGTVLLAEVGLVSRLQAVGWLDPFRSAAVALCGFGLVLSGLSIMQAAGPYVQNSAMFDWFLDKASSNLWWGLVAGAVITAAVHSSTAVIGLAMGFAATGVLPAPLGIAIMLGANVGTCMTAVLASIGGSRAGRLVAVSHIALNVGGALLFMPLVHELSIVSGLLSHTPSSQIARAQTLFNIVSSLLALPLCYLRILRRLEPIRT